MSRFELLIVATIIGLVGTVSGVAVLVARAQTRDIARVAHIRDAQIGLELYFNDNASYPAENNPLPLGTTTSVCLSEDGFAPPCREGETQTAYLEIVPSPPTTGLNGRVSCGGVKNAYCYESDGATYGITFELERKARLMGLEKGLNCARPEGIKSGACPSFEDLVPVTQE